MNQANRLKIQMKLIECFLDGDASGSRCWSQYVRLIVMRSFFPIVLPSTKESVSLNFSVCLQIILRSFYHHCRLRFYSVSCAVSGESFITATLCETPSNTFWKDKSKIAFPKCDIYCTFSRVFSSIQNHSSCTHASIATILFFSGTHLN